MPNSLNILGLARKAGMLETGEEAAGAACRAGKARLLIVASDASDNARHRADNFAAAGQTPRADLNYTKEELGAILSGGPSMAALTDAGMAAAFLRRLAEEFPNRYDGQLEELETKAGRVLERRREAEAHMRNVRKGKRRTKR